MLINFNKTMAITLVSTALLNVCSTKCMDSKYMNYEDMQKSLHEIQADRAAQYENINRKEMCLFGGWTGLSAGSFIGKKILNNLSEKYPAKKQQYLKYARYSRNFGCFAAIPFVSFTAAVSAEILQYFGNKPFEPVGLVTQILAQPLIWMVFKPVVLNETFKIKKMNAKNASKE